MDHLTRREAQSVMAYAAWVSQFLGLPRWRVVLGDQPCGKDAHAEVEWIHLRNQATLRLCREWMTLDADLRRDTITHEVIHLTHTKVTWQAEKVARRHMDKATHAEWWFGLSSELELMVDMLAGCLSNTAEAKRAWANAYGR